MNFYDYNIDDEKLFIISQIASLLLCDEKNCDSLAPKEIQLRSALLASALL